MHHKRREVVSRSWATCFAPNPHFQPHFLENFSSFRISTTTSRINLSSPPSRVYSGYRGRKHLKAVVRRGRAAFPPENWISQIRHFILVLQRGHQMRGATFSSSIYLSPIIKSWFKLAPFSSLISRKGKPRTVHTKKLQVEHVVALLSLLIIGERATYTREERGSLIDATVVTL